MTARRAKARADRLATTLAVLLIAQQHRREGRRYVVTLTLKYFAAGWWQITADVLCSGTS